MVTQLRGDADRCDAIDRARRDRRVSRVSQIIFAFRRDHPDQKLELMWGWISGGWQDGW